MIYDTDSFVAQTLPLFLGPNCSQLVPPFERKAVGSDAVVDGCCEMLVPVARCFDAQSYECIEFRALYTIVESLVKANIRGREEGPLGARGKPG